MARKPGLYLKKFTLNRQGVSDLFCSSEVGYLLRNTGQAIANTTGHPQDYNVRTPVLGHSAVGIVEIQPGNYPAYYRELKTNDLLKAMSSTGLPSSKPQVEQSIPDVLQEML